MIPETIPAPIAKAIIATTRDTGTLIKNEYNKHGGFPFVGIDQFYERVASKAAEHGLSWVAREDEFAVVEGTKNPMIRVTYSFSVFHESGAAVPGFSRMTIIHPIQGAQTVGSALSYAMKNWMRQTFKLATGEKGDDADATNPADLDLPPAKPATRSKQEAKAPAPSFDEDEPQPEVDDALIEKVKGVTDKLVDGMPVFVVPDDVEQAKMIAAIFTEFVGTCESMKVLKGFWNENVAALEKLAKLDADGHAGVKSAFTARRNQIEKKEKARG